MLTIVTWLWRGNRDYHPRHVDRLAQMLAKYCPVPYRFLCITSDYDTSEFGEGVEAIPAPAAAMELAGLRNPEGESYPHCYRRLWMFAPEARGVLGERVLLIDVDTVIVGDLNHVVERTEPFVGMRQRTPWGRLDRLSGALYLMNTGEYPDVWTDFSIERARVARSQHFRGSDQAWISYKLRDRVALWDNDWAGLYSAPEDLATRGGRARLPNPALPAGAALVTFNGYIKPWHSAQAHSVWPWLREHYPWSD